MNDKTVVGSSTTKLIQYLEGCAALGEQLGSDGLAYVSPVELRKAIALLRPAPETNESELVIDAIVAGAAPPPTQSANGLHCATCQCPRANSPMPLGPGGVVRKRSWHQD
jgi:hypothetical protein